MTTPTEDWWTPIAQALGLGGSTIAIVGSAFVIIRRIWQGVKVADARVEGTESSFDQLYKLLDDKDETIKSLREDLSTTHQRLDQAYKERNDAVSQIGALQVKVEFLIKQVEYLQAQVQALQHGKDNSLPAPESG